MRRRTITGLATFVVLAPSLACLAIDAENIGGSGSYGGIRALKTTYSLSQPDSDSTVLVQAC